MDVMRLVRKGGYPYNLLATVFGEYEQRPNDSRANWERKILQFVRALQRGGDEKIERDWNLCRSYFDGTVTFKEIGNSYGLSVDEVGEGIYRFTGLLSMYWRENPNFTKATKDFLTMIISRTGSIEVVNVLRSAGITSNAKLLTYCKKNGDGFERIPALLDTPKREIQNWVRNNQK